MYSSDWSGYAALPKTAGRTFTSIVANYNVPSVASSNSPYTFSFHWIGLDEWADQTVEQDGISANCEGSTPHYHAWYEMYAANSHYGIPVNPGDTIESSIIRYLGGAEYELSLKDVTSSQGFDVVQTCPVSACDNSSAEAITEAYYYDRQFLRHQRLRRRALRGCNRDRQRGQCRRPVRPKGWKTGEGIALGEYRDVNTYLLCVFGLLGPGELTHAGCGHESHHARGAGVVPVHRAIAGP